MFRLTAHCFIVNGILTMVRMVNNMYSKVRSRSKQTYDWAIVYSNWTAQYRKKKFIGKWVLRMAGLVILMELIMVTMEFFRKTELSISIVWIVSRCSY